MSVLASLGCTAAFLAPLPAWHEPPQEPAWRPLGGWLSTAVVGLAVLTMTAPPVAIALSAHQAEAAFRARCGSVGGHVALVRSARHPHGCVRV